MRMTIKHSGKGIYKVVDTITGKNMYKGTWFACWNWLFENATEKRDNEIIYQSTVL